MKIKKISQKNIIFFLLGLYTILPDYFKIAGQNSALICAAIIIGIYFLLSFRSISRIDKRIAGFCSVYFFLAGLIHIIHGEWSQAIRVVLEYCILFIIVYSLIKSKDDYKKMIDIIIGFALIEAITTYIHFFTDFNIFSLIQSSNLSAFSLDSATQYRNGMIRVEGSFGHAITYAIYISICACLCLYMYNEYKKRKYLIFYFMCVLSLVMSISRMPILVFLGSQFIYLMALDYKKTFRIIGKTLLILVPSIVILSVALPDVFKMLTGIVGLVSDVFSATGLSGLSTFETESAFTYRAEMIRVLPELIKQSPLFGIGGASYRSSSFYFLIGGTRQTSIDNEYLHHLLLYGFWGLAGMLWWVFGPIHQSKMSIRRCMNEKSLPLFKIMIIFVYAMNLFSVAMMFEYKLIIVIYAIFLADIELRGRGEVENEKTYPF